ncbi:hypothetical protein CsSME_00012457 [Camellia sinensis var. sinensis]
MASYIEISRCNLIPLSLSSLCACHSRRPSSSSSLKTLILTRPNSSNLRPSLLFDGSRRVFRVPRGISVNHPRVITAVASTEPDRLDEGETKEVWYWLEDGFSRWLLLLQFLLVHGSTLN